MKTPCRSWKPLTDLHVLLDISVVKPTTDQSLSVENGVGWVHGSLVLGGISDQTLSVGEGDVRGGGPEPSVDGLSCPSPIGALLIFLGERRFPPH
jgi:hypothetical protein